MHSCTVGEFYVVYASSTMTVTVSAAMTNSVSNRHRLWS